MPPKTSSRTIVAMSEKDIPHNDHNEPSNSENDAANASDSPSKEEKNPKAIPANETDDSSSNNDATETAEDKDVAEEPKAPSTSTENSDAPEHATSQSSEEGASNQEDASATSTESDTGSQNPSKETAEQLSNAAQTAKTYLKKAAQFLGLNKKASAAAAAVALCAVVGIGTAVASSTAPKQPNELPLSEAFVQHASDAAAASLDGATNRAKANFIAASLTPAALNGVDACTNAPGAFSLVAGQETPAIPEEEQANLTSAAQGIEAGGYTVGFMLINLSTGKGIAYNLDSRVYGASSFKGPYGAYLCQHLGDGDISYPAGADSAGAGISGSIDSLLQPMILNSDNDAFSSLRNAYDSSGFAEWLSACGVDSSIMHDTHFPRYSARESALLWLHAYQYLKTETPTAQHLASLYAHTNVSFIRSGVGSVDGVETVLNKAGWCASGARFTGLCDAGLIECSDGTTYLMSTMTNAPDGSLYTVRLANLANALFACRGALD